MSLRTYQLKRDFRHTPEPRGRQNRGQTTVSRRRIRNRGLSPVLRYVIQKHAARRLHYDFRLELDGTLKSWAVPKGPSLDPGEKRLAVHVEDHPIEYGDFEGVIPEKHYGAGSVALWDRGTWTPRGDAREGYRKGRLKFELDGEKLHGAWALVRMRGREAPNGKENWLLVKDSDEAARPGEGTQVIEERPESVVSGRTVEEIAAGKTAKRVRAHKRNAKPAVAHGRKAPFPAKLEPQLATLVAAPPADEGWAWEIKFDGYRLLARLKNGRASLRTRNGLDWSDRFAGLARALEQLPLENAWLDGEACVVDDKGVSSFSGLQQALAGTRGGTRGAGEPVLMLFDLLYADGEDLRALPYRERRARLEALLKDASPALRLSTSISGSGAEALAAACRLGLEGLIGKRPDGRYTSGRSREWIKLKCRQRQEFVIGGYTAPRGSRNGFGALLLGVYEKDELRYAGRVGAGFDATDLETLHARLAKLQRASPPFAKLPRGVSSRGVQWVAPKLVAEVSFAEWTADRIVRQGSFEGLREDKPARAIGTEKALPASRIAKKKKAASDSGARRAGARAGGRVTVAGVSISHPDRIVYPGTEVTKLQVAEYYARIAPLMLRYLRNRPVSLVRCPEGAAGECFFQKHATAREIPGVETVMIEESHGRKPYLLANSAQALVGLAQMGTLELHVWGATADDIERPDTLVLDLDPDEGLAWERVIEAAQMLHALLDELGLRCFVKTTGGKGLHVVVPLVRRQSWDELKDFSRAVATHMSAVLPERFTATLSKAKRKGRIFIDYLRNGRGATAVAPYSLRARAEPTIAMPLAWPQVKAKLDPKDYRVDRLPARLSDPWKDYARVRQSLTAALKRRLKDAAAP